jgi:hypothetical protein
MMPEAWRLGANKTEQRECDRLEREAMKHEAQASELRAARKKLINKYAQRAKSKQRKA